jgi:hypothetical protein
MQTAQKPPTGKNELWTAYQADPVVRVAIQQELEKIELYRYWLETASKEGYYLPDAKGRLIIVFLHFLPETAILFGLQQPKSGAKASLPTTTQLSLSFR